MALRDVLVNFTVSVDQRPLVDAQQNVQKLISSFNGLARIAQFALAAIGVGKLTDSVDEYITLENKLKAVTNSTEEFVTAQRGVEKIADEVAVPIADVADSFLRYSLATESLGASQAEVLDFTKRVTQAMILSGASAEEAHRAAVQLSQGFGKNFQAAAQDLKSVKEQAPVLARIIEKAAGAVPGALLQAAKEGKINSKLVFDAVRADGEELDRAFAKRQKRFEDISNLLGNQWLKLMRQLKPAFVPLINALEDVVHWIGEWVKDGSALNAMIAAATVAIGTLAFALAPLAIEAAAAALPFVALFLALDDIVSFFNGDESLIEEGLDKVFGVEKVEAFRKELQKVLPVISAFLAAIGGENNAEFEMLSWRLGRAVTAALKTAWDAFVEYAYASDNPISSLIRWSTAKKDTKSEDKSFFQMTPGEFFGGALGRGDEFTKRYNAEHPENAPPELMPTPTLPVVPPNWEPVGTLPPTFTSPYGQSNMSPASSPVITNNITVEGNATPDTARQIGYAAGAATSQSLGRDRAAVGAGFGVK